MLSLPMARCFPRYTFKREAHKQTSDGKLSGKACMKPKQVELPAPLGMTQPKTMDVTTTCLHAQDETLRVLCMKITDRTWVGYLHIFIWHRLRLLGIFNLFVHSCLERRPQPTRRGSKTPAGGSQRVQGGLSWELPGHSGWGRGGMLFRVLSSLFLSDLF